ncbi:MAG: sulfite exporter TauE/SafE family protein [Rhodocyclaceae bacterium]|nr:sulfite exporter TauE/SafE family protein [Rhodocyclaceae bacterium]
MLDLTASQELAFAAVWLLGVSLGLTACAATCLPFLGAWTFGRAGGRSEAFQHTLAFVLGRLVSYTLLGAFSASFGRGLTEALGMRTGNWMIGGASLLAGLWLFYRLSAVSQKARSQPAPQPLRFQRPRRDAMPVIFLGASVSLVPCAPLASLLALAAQAGSWPLGAGYGFFFGLGAATTPLWLFVPLLGHLGGRLVHGRYWLRRWLLLMAAIVLMGLGLQRLFLAV